MTRRAVASVALVGAALVASGCTLRYSQTMVGRIVRVQPHHIQNRDGGVEAGVGFGPLGAVVTIKEPMSGRELLAVPCSLGLTQLDYRSMNYGFYLAVAIPNVEAQMYCALEPEQPDLVGEPPSDGSSTGND